MTDAGRDHSDFTVEIYDVTTLKEVSRTGNEVRYHCPFCSDKRGRADKDGKLYFNIVKQKGYCFLCHSSIYPEGSEDGRLDKDELAWKLTVERMLRFYPDTLFDNLEFPHEVSFDFPDLTPALLNYLKERNPFLIPLKDCLGLQAWRGRDTGVVIPFIYHGKICKFQSRFVTRGDVPLAKDDKMKYYTSPGPKPLYSPFHIFGNFKGVGHAEELTICEGVFDAIALAIMGFPNPVAILGDRLTPLHIWDIRHLSPIISKIYLCLDDMGRNILIEKVVRKFIPCVEDIEKFSFWLPHFKDPEEWLRDQLPKNEELATLCAGRITEWLNSFNPEEKIHNHDTPRCETA